MHQLLAFRHAEGGRSVKGQDHPPGGEPFHFAGIEAGSFYARAAGAFQNSRAAGQNVRKGFSPNSGGVSLRTFNRNFEGRSGTADGQVYLVSPETAVAAALTGEITDPMLLGKMPEVTMPKAFKIDDSAVIPPACC